MNEISSRRDFFRRTALAGGALLMSGAAVPAGAIEPFARKGTSRLLLSIAAYSFRDNFQPKEGVKKISLFDFIDYCAEQGCQGAELTSYYFPTDLTDSFLLDVKRHAFLRGVEVSGGAVRNDFTLPTTNPNRKKDLEHVKRWVDHAALLGAPHIRVFAGTDKGADAAQLCIDGLQECGEYAATKGVFLGLENHGGIVAEPGPLLKIIQAVKSPWVGINLDSANFKTADPYTDFATLAPYAVNVQMKAEVFPGGKGEPADLARLVGSLKKANYQGYIAIEYESKEDPWIAVPRLVKELKPLLA